MKYFSLILLIVFSGVFFSCDDDSNITDPLNWNFTANYTGEITHKTSTIIGTAMTSDDKIIIGANDTYNQKNLTISISTFGTTAKTYLLDADPLNIKTECACVVNYDDVQYLGAKGKVTLSSVGANVKGTFEFTCYDKDLNSLTIKGGSFYLKLN